MRFVVAQSWRDRVLQLQEVKDRCNALIAELGDHGIAQNDARTQTLVHVRQMCNSTALVAVKLQQNAENPNNVTAIASLLGLADRAALERVLGDLNSNSKAAFLTMTVFALEHGVQCVLDAAPGSHVEPTFDRAVSSLMRYAGVPDGDRGALKERLMLPAWMRNALHRNGMTKDRRTVSAGGAVFEFTPGQRLDCGSWSHVFVATWHAVDAYGALVLMGPVQSLPVVEE